jgi:hypothetical protein
MQNLRLRPRAATRGAVAAAIVAGLLVARTTRADDPPVAAALPAAATPPVEPSASEPPPKPTRRSGFTFGLALGPGIASFAGYPNDVTKIGYPAYYTTSGVKPSVLLEAWLGGAINDYFTVSLGFKGSTLLADGTDKARSAGLMFHLEGFPLFALGGHLRDLGVRFEAGLGTASLTDASGNKLIDGSATSMIGGGFFYEGIRAWKTAHGPFLAGEYVWSETIQRPAIFLGWRSVIYARP